MITAPTATPTPYVLPFSAIGAGDIARVGGKGANLGVLAAAGFHVPPGFCVTTAAFKTFVDGDATFDDALGEISHLASTDIEAARRVGSRLREHIRSKPVPDDIAAAVVAAWHEAGTERSYAVRSSATAEDLPDASFAGQQDTYLNVRGEAGLLDRVRACWASLYTGRAILYRIENGIPSADVSLAVVVQHMVKAEKSGVLFTADPITGHRFTTVIDAGFGLGESIVSGLISADYYKVDTRAKAILEVRVGDKTLAITAREGGGTNEETLSAERRTARVLSEAEVLALSEIGELIAALQGSPQDIEWCIHGGAISIVQSRPITTLYPLPEPAPVDGLLHVSFCVNHFQVMTDAMPPMALSIWRLLLPLGKRPGTGGESPWVQCAGGRLFADVSRVVRFALTRHMLLKILGGVDKLAASALTEVASRPDFAKGPHVRPQAVARVMLPRLAGFVAWLLWRDPAGAVAGVSRQFDEIEADLAGTILNGALPERLRAASDNLSTLIWRLLHLPPMVLSGVLAGVLVRRLTRRSDADFAALGRGLTGNVTTEMDLAVGDLADLARAHPAVAKSLVAERPALADVAAVEGGAVFTKAFDDFIARYGMRGPAEIDISRPRYRDEPGSVLRTIASSLRGGEPGHHRTHHARMAAEGEAVAARLIEEAGAGVWGWLRRPIVRRLIRLHRELLPLREHPKYMLVRALDLVRRTALEAGALLNQQGRLADARDVWFLELGELADALDDPERTLAPADRRAPRRARALQAALSAEGADQRGRKPGGAPFDGEHAGGRPCRQRRIGGNRRGHRPRHPRSRGRGFAPRRNPDRAVYRSRLDAVVSQRRRAGDGGWRDDDAWLGRRPRVRHPRCRLRARCHDQDHHWPARPRQRRRRLCRGT